MNIYTSSNISCNPEVGSMFLFQVQKTAQSQEQSRIVHFYKLSDGEKYYPEKDDLLVRGQLAAIAKGDISLFKNPLAVELVASGIQKKAAGKLAEELLSGKKKVSDIPQIADAASIELKLLELKQDAVDYVKWASTRNAEAAVVIADRFWSTISSALKSEEWELVRAWNFLCVNPLLTEKGKQELANSLVEEMHFSQQAASEMVPRLWSNEIGKPAEVQLTQLGDAGAGEQREKVNKKMVDLGNKETLGAYFRNKIYDSRVSMDNLPEFAGNMVKQLEDYLLDAQKRGGSQPFKLTELLRAGRWIDAVTILPWNVVYNLKQAANLMSGGSPGFGLVNSGAGTILEDISRDIAGGMGNTLYDEKRGDHWYNIPANAFKGAFMFLADLTSLPSWYVYLDAKSTAFPSSGILIPQDIDIASLRYNIACMDTLFLLALLAGPEGAKIIKQTGRELVFARAKYQLIIKLLEEGAEKKLSYSEAEKIAEQQIGKLRSGLKTAEESAPKKGPADWFKSKPLYEAEEYVPKTRKDLAEYISQRSGNMLREGLGIPAEIEVPNITIQVPTLTKTLFEGPFEEVKSIGRARGRLYFGLHEKTSQLAENYGLGGAERREWLIKRRFLGRTGDPGLPGPIADAIGEIGEIEAGLGKSSTTRATLRELRKAAVEAHREVFRPLGIGKTGRKEKLEKLQQKVKEDKIKLEKRKKEIDEKIKPLEEKIKKTEQKKEIMKLEDEIKEIEAKIKGLGSGNDVEITELEGKKEIKEAGKKALQKDLDKTEDGKAFKKLDNELRGINSALAGIESVLKATDANIFERLGVYISTTWNTFFKTGALPHGTPEWMAKMVDYAKSIFPKYRKWGSEIDRLAPKLASREAALNDAINGFREGYCRQMNWNPNGLTTAQADEMGNEFIKYVTEDAKAGNRDAAKALQAVNDYMETSREVNRLHFNRRLVVGIALAGITPYLVEKYNDYPPGEVPLRMLADAGSAAYDVGMGALAFGEGTLEIMAINRFASMYANHPGLWLAPADPLQQRLAYQVANTINPAVGAYSTRTTMHLENIFKPEPKKEFREENGWVSEPIVKENSDGTSTIYLSLNKQYREKYPDLTFRIYDQADKRVLPSKESGITEYKETQPGILELEKNYAYRAYKIATYSSKLETEGRASFTRPLNPKDMPPELLQADTTKAKMDSSLAKLGTVVKKDSLPAAQVQSPGSALALTEPQQKLAKTIKVVVDDLRNIAIKDTKNDTGMKSDADRIIELVGKVKKPGQTDQDVYDALALKMSSDGLDISRNTRGTQISTIKNYLLGMVPENER